MLKEIITADEATIRGLKKYFTGRACKHNHLCERWVNNSQCVDCQMAYVKVWQKNNRDKINAGRRKLRKEGSQTLPPSERIHDREKRKERIRKHRKSSYEKHKVEQISKAGRDKPSECEICQQTDVRICFDHCHETGLFRGWLCVRCNSALGLVQDNVNVLTKLIEYLKKFKDSYVHSN